MRNVPLPWLKVPLEAERIREVFRLAIVAGHSVIAELSYELQRSKFEVQKVRLRSWFAGSG